MDFTEILKELNTASLFDLHRLKSAIYQELINPERIAVIKNRLKPGQKISYFDPDNNGLIEAIVIQGKKTKCLVEHIEDGVRWNIPFYYINLEGVNTDIQPTKNQKGIEKSVLKVGDRVGYLNKEINEVYGVVIRLNPKTATIKERGFNNMRKFDAGFLFVFKA